MEMRNFKREILALLLIKLIEMMRLFVSPVCVAVYYVQLGKPKLGGMPRDL